ncbi:MAG: serine acetyltransferase [Pseudomonadota bacterium]
MKLLIEDLKYKQHVYKLDGLEYSLFRILTTDGTSAIVLYRLMRWLKQYRLGPLALFVGIVNKLLNQCVIGTDARFGAGFVLMHPNGVVVNSRVQGGEGVVVESGVVIGSEKGHTPRLGNHIFIGSGAKIIGAVTLGDHAKVGANAVVVNDVDSSTTVVGIPAKPIRRKACASSQAPASVQDAPA